MSGKSTELAVSSPQLLCFQIMQHYGTDRSNGSRFLFDADVISHDSDGTPYTMRLIQERGFGWEALYTLRARTDFSPFQSIYKYYVAANTLTQQIAADSAVSPEFITLEPKTLLPLLHGVFREV